MKQKTSTRFKRWLDTGTTMQLAKVIKCDPAEISRWKLGRRIPDRRHFNSIIKASNGYLNIYDLVAEVKNNESKSA